MNVKKLIVVAGASFGVLALLRRFGPVLRERAMAKCQEMLNRMPDDFPPKRMMRGIEEIRANTARTRELLEEQRGESEPVGEASSVSHAP